MLLVMFHAKSFPNFGQRKILCGDIISEFRDNNSPFKVIGLDINCLLSWLENLQILYSELIQRHALTWQAINIKGMMNNSWNK